MKKQKQASELLGKSWLYSGDVNWSDYGGTWIRHVGARVYHVIRFDNWVEMVGEREAREGGSKYCCELALVDLNALSEEQIKGARSYVGADDEELDDAWLALACHDYGSKAPMWGESGNNAHALLRQARAESATLRRDASVLDDRMSRPVNKIGSTALEYMTGDLNSPILRGLAAGDPAAEIMVKMGMLR